MCICGKSSKKKKKKHEKKTIMKTLQTCIKFVHIRKCYCIIVLVRVKMCSLFPTFFDIFAKHVSKLGHCCCAWYIFKIYSLQIFVRATLIVRLTRNSVNIEERRISVHI